MNCQKCNSTKYYTKPNKRRIGLYCADCNAWICWIPYLKLCNLYHEIKPIAEDKAIKKITKRSGITTMRCSNCECLLYNSCKRNIQNQFDLVNAKFCPKCGRQFIL